MPRIPDSDLIHFAEYCRDFYGPGGLYDMGCKLQDIMNATRRHIRRGADFAGDTFDREAVREILIAEYGYTWPESRYSTELTPEGEQTVIPGCERNQSDRATQLDLF